MMTEQATVPFLDIGDPEFDFDRPEVTEARERNWYAMSPYGPVVLRYEEARDVLRDPRFKLGGAAYMEFQGITQGPLYDWWMNAMMAASPEAHARMRSLLNRVFTPRSTERLQPFVRRTVRHLGAALGATESSDFVARFAAPLPAWVMCELIGVPAQDYDDFSTWSNDIGLIFARAEITRDVLSRIDDAVTNMSAYVQSLIDRPRPGRGDDLLSRLIAARQAGELTASELRDLAILLVWAGQDTTSRQLGRMIVAFAQHPEQWELVSRDPQLVPQAVEEVMRWSPQVRLNMRFAAEDLRFHGLHVPKHSPVWCCVPQANRDGRSFNDPEQFDVTASRQSSHLVFGGGMYFCLGAALARLEMQETLASLVAHYTPPTIVGKIAWRHPLAVIHGPDILRVQFSLRD